MNKFLYLIISFLSICISAQKTVDGKIILKSGEELHVPITFSNPSSFTKIIKFTEKDEDKELNANELNSLNFTDLKSVSHHFIPWEFSNGTELVEVLYDGNIRWLKRYYWNMTFSNFSGMDFFQNKITNVEVYPQDMYPIPKKKLKILTEDEPSMENFIKKLGSPISDKGIDSAIKTVLVEYDRLKNNLK